MRFTLVWSRGGAVLGGVAVADKAAHTHAHKKCTACAKRGHNDRVRMGEKGSAPYTSALGRRHGLLAHGMRATIVIFFCPPAVLATRASGACAGTKAMLVAATSARTSRTIVLFIIVLVSFGKG
jgi:hypothetical protein